MLKCLLQAGPETASVAAEHPDSRGRPCFPLQWLALHSRSTSPGAGKALLMIINAYPQALAVEGIRLPLARLFEEPMDDAQLLRLVESLLLERPQCATRELSDSRRLLHVVIASVQGICGVEAVRLVLEAAPAAAQVANDDGRLPAHLAALHLRGKGRAAVLTQLLAAHPAAAQALDGAGQLPLHVALSCGASDEALPLLLDAHPEGAKVATGRDELPLHLAVQFQPSEAIASAVMQLLKLNPQAVSQELGETGALPLHLLLASFSTLSGAAAVAGQHARLDTVEFLLKADGKTASKAAQDGWLPLHLFTSCPMILDKKALHVAKLLLKRCPQAATARTSEGWLPLHLFLRSMQEGPEYIALLKLLLQPIPRDEDASADATGWLPLHMAACFLSGDLGHQTVDLLLKHSPAAVRTKNNDGNIALSLACESIMPASLDMVRLLHAAFPAGVFSKNDEGDTPLDIALHNKSCPENVVAFLRSVASGV